MELQVKDQTIYYQVQYTKATTIQLDLSPEGHTTVKAPVGTKNYEIEKFVFKNASKILKRYEEIQNRVFISSQKTYEAESNFLFLGKAYTLQEILTLYFESTGKTQEYESFHNAIPQDKIQALLKKFYTRKTKEIVKKRVAYYESLMQVKAKQVTVVNSPKTWGTCDSNKELTFHFKLSMAAIDVIDYVVIHELCHLSHMNHDRSFYRLLGAYDKNYKFHEAYLAKIGPVMTI